jgi:chlorite dismutase
MNPRARGTVPVTFAAGARGRWYIERMAPVRGESLPRAERLDRFENGGAPAGPSVWTLRGVATNSRYTERAEKSRLEAVQETLDRPAATRAALIPVLKSRDWWELPQDERRAIFESRSQHISVGLEYLPAVARKLYHCRELGEPFDFLTWFEFAPEHAEAFEELVSRLRATEEWRYVEREVDVRLVRT